MAHGQRRRAGGRRARVPVGPGPTDSPFVAQQHRFDSPRPGRDPHTDDDARDESQGSTQTVPPRRLVLVRFRVVARSLAQAHKWEVREGGPLVARSSSPACDRAVFRVVTNHGKCQAPRSFYYRLTRARKFRSSCESTKRWSIECALRRSCQLHPVHKQPNNR